MSHTLIVRSVEPLKRGNMIKGLDTAGCPVGSKGAVDTQTLNESF